MPREIELKAKIQNSEAIKTKAARFAPFCGTFEKEDAYWHQNVPQENSGYGVRVRREIYTDASGKTEHKNYVTWKTKEVRDGVEFNDEKEFEISPVPVFAEFLKSLKFTQTISKTKKGAAYKKENLTIEITEVKNLGWFTELEILLPDNQVNDEAAAKEKLLFILDELGVKRDAIESRPYTQLLSDNAGADQQRV
ncbi:MAG: class IV adenylate cyclase [Treponema sp.]|nr:class IV adenylate cyclase [Treponema sp.]